MYLKVEANQWWNKSDCPAIKPGDKLEIEVYGSSGTYLHPTVNNNLTVSIPGKYKDVKLSITGNPSSPWTPAQNGGQFLLQCDTEHSHGGGGGGEPFGDD